MMVIYSIQWLVELPRYVVRDILVELIWTLCGYITEIHVCNKICGEIL